jgi:hypothetical protein
LPCCRWHHHLPNTCYCNNARPECLWGAKEGSGTVQSAPACARASRQCVSVGCCCSQGRLQGVHTRVIRSSRIDSRTPSLPPGESFWTVQGERVIPERPSGKRHRYAGIPHALRSAEEESHHTASRSHSSTTPSSYIAHPIKKLAPYTAAAASPTNPTRPLLATCHLPPQRNRPPFPTANMATSSHPTTARPKSPAHHRRPMRPDSAPNSDY